MKRDDAITILKRHRAELEAVGVAHAYLFGSVARDEAGEESDVDVMIDVFNNDRFGLFELAGVWNTLKDIFKCEVDIAIRVDQLSENRKLYKAAQEAMSVF